jgi:hypothetical protein
MMRYLPVEIWAQIYEYDPTFRREVWATVLLSLPKRTMAISSVKAGFLYTAEKVIWGAYRLTVDTTSPLRDKGSCGIFFEASDRVSVPDLKDGLRKYLEWISRLNKKSDPAR